MRHRAQFERDVLHFNLLETLKDSLENLNNLRLVPPDDARVLDLKNACATKSQKSNAKEVK